MNYEFAIRDLEKRLAEIESRYLKLTEILIEKENNLNELIKILKKILLLKYKTERRKKFKFKWLKK